VGAWENLKIKKDRSGIENALELGGGRRQSSFQVFGEGRKNVGNVGRKSPENMVEAW